MSTQEVNLKAIADAIRAKDGATDPIPANTFAERIGGLTSPATEDGLVSGSLIGTYKNDRITSITRAYAFAGCNYVDHIVLPAVKTLGMQSLASSMFISTVDLAACEKIDAYSFYYCMYLEKLILRNAQKVCTLTDKNAFTETGTYGSGLAIYVPDALVEDYKVATNWSNFADQIKPLSELEE